MSPLPPSPIVRVEITRGATVETEHAIVCAVVGADGELFAASGDVHQRFPVRSTVKPLQALTLVASGAADAYSLTDAELALACGSHNGEPDHVQTVSAWLERLGLSEAHLQCGVATPMVAAWDVLDADYLAKRTRLKHNCSGKHAGFLTQSLHLGVDPLDYLDPVKPVQHAVLGRLATMCGIEPEALVVGGDGCGAPVISVGASSLATAMTALLGDAAECGRVLSVIEGNPWFMAGTGRFDTRVTTALGGNGFTKVGAEGGHVAVLRDPGLAIAMKTMTGDPRATESAMFHLLCQFGVLDPLELSDLAAGEIFNSAGAVVGEVRVRGLDEFLRR